MTRHAFLGAAVAMWRTLDAMMLQQRTLPSLAPFPSQPSVFAVSPTRSRWWARWWAPWKRRASQKTPLWSPLRPHCLRPALGLRHWRSVEGLRQTKSPTKMRGTGAWMMLTSASKKWRFRSFQQEDAKLVDLATRHETSVKSRQPTQCGEKRQRRKLPRRLDGRIGSCLNALSHWCKVTPKGQRWTLMKRHLTTRSISEPMLTWMACVRAHCSLSSE